jgi:hypothetical protein
LRHRLCTDFRPIDSGTTGSRLVDAYKEFPSDWFEGLDIKKQVTRGWGSYDTVSLFAFFNYRCPAPRRASRAGTTS